MAEKEDVKNLRVAVIGIGTAGVSALHWCRVRGFGSVVGFEREDGCGGIWRAGSRHSPAYDSLYTNSSGAMMLIGDHPTTFKSNFPSHREIREYYELYLKHKGLDPLVRWRTNVERLFKRDGKWIIASRDLGSGEMRPEDHFDRVIVATGKLWDPSYPEWASPLFQGNKFASDVHHNGMDVLHSRQYRNPAPFARKRVVVVGVGNSALDVSLELARDPDVVKPVLVSCRRGAVVMPMHSTTNQALDVIVTTRAFQYLATASVRSKVMVSQAGPVNKRMRELGLPAPPNTKTLFAVENPVSNIKDSVAYIKALEQGLIKFVPGVEGFSSDPRSLRMSDGTELKGVDSLVLCTGYCFGINFLEDSVRRDVLPKVRQKNGREIEYVDLYKSTLYAKDPTLGFLVLVTSFGNESIVGWMQARWLSMVFADAAFKARVFSKQKSDKESQTKARNAVESNSPTPYFVRYLPYMDDMAKDLGVLPDIKRLLTWNSTAPDWVTAFNLLFGPSSSAQYLLDGPDRSQVAADYLASRL